jgi:hypothetical protein
MYLILAKITKHFDTMYKSIISSVEVYIPEAVNKLALSAHLDHSCKTGWNKHDSSYYSKKNVDDIESAKKCIYWNAY